MPVSLQVSQIRDQILMAAGGPTRSNGGHTNRLTGALFHEVFADLFGGQPSLHARTALANVGPDQEEWRRALREHAYRLLLGPRLQANHAVLQSASVEVIALWTAVQALTEWSADLLHRAWRNQSATGASAADVASIIVAEQAVVWSLREPGWTDSVVISGITDAICRAPETEAWCVVEFKTGSSAPEADLTQACLYHQMLSAIHGSHGSLALVYFTPKVAQRTPKQLEVAQAKLRELIGRLAGVLPGPPSKPIMVAAALAAESSSLRLRRAPEPLHLELGRKVLGVFREYNAPVESAGDPIMGPTFLRFPVRPARGVRPEAVRKLGSALQVRLNLTRQPFVHNTGGRMVVDVERADRETVLFSSISDQLPSADPVAGCSKIPVGVDLEGQLRLPLRHPRGPAFLLRYVSVPFAKGTTLKLGPPVCATTAISVAGVSITNEQPVEVGSVFVRFATTDSAPALSSNSGRNFLTAMRFFRTRSLSRQLLDRSYPDNLKASGRSDSVRWRQYENPTRSGHWTSPPKRGADSPGYLERLKKLAAHNWHTSRRPTLNSTGSQSKIR